MIDWEILCFATVQATNYLDSEIYFVYIWNI